MVIEIVGLRLYIEVWPKGADGFAGGTGWQNYMVFDRKRKKREKLGLIHWSYGNVNMGLLLCLGQQVSTARCSVWAVLCRAGMAPKGWARGRLLPDS